MAKMLKKSNMIARRPLYLSATLTVEEWLQPYNPDVLDRTLNLLKSCKEISLKVRTASCDKLSCFNDNCGEQLALEDLANGILIRNLRSTETVGSLVSTDNCKISSAGKGGSFVAFTPLDGSASIDSNIAVGTVWGIWPENLPITGATGRALQAAGMAVYGSRTTVLLALEEVPSVHEFQLMDNGQWLKTNEFQSIYDGKAVSPGNLRAARDNKGYASLCNFWLKDNYQLWHSASIVADVNRLVVKGQGVIVHASSKSTKPKVNLLCQAIPLAYIVEKAGGKSSDGEQSLLDVSVQSAQQVVQCALGEAGEVERFEQVVGKKYI
eukprot:gene25085-30299_t